MANYYSLYDPLVGNGIMPMPINSMVFGGMPLMTSYGYPSGAYYNNCLRADTFTKSRSQENRNLFKQFALLALGTGLAIAGIRKFKRFKAMGWSGIKNGIADRWHSFTDWFKR